MPNPMNTCKKPRSIEISQYIQLYSSGTSIDGLQSSNQETRWESQMKPKVFYRSNRHISYIWIVWWINIYMVWYSGICIVFHRDSVIGTGDRPYNHRKAYMESVFMLAAKTHIWYVYYTELRHVDDKSVYSMFQIHHCICYMQIITIGCYELKPLWDMHSCNPDSFSFEAFLLWLSLPELCVTGHICANIDGNLVQTSFYSVFLSFAVNLMTRKLSSNVNLSAPLIQYMLVMYSRNPL